MGITSAASAVVEAIANFLDPDKREMRVVRKENTILRQAIGAAEELLMIERKQGKYVDMTSKRVRDLQIHFQKQFDAWKDGKA